MSENNLKLYESHPTNKPQQTTLYAVPPEQAEGVVQLNSLSELVKKPAVETNDTQTFVKKPTKEDKEELLRQALENSKIAPTPATSGPTQEQREQLAKLAMSTKDVQTGPGKRFPTEADKQKFFEQALKEAEAKLARKEENPDVFEEERRKALEASQNQNEDYFEKLRKEALAARKQGAGSKVVAGPPTSKNAKPSAEDRARLAQQAFNHQKASAPTPEQRALLAQQAFTNMQRSAPTPEQRALLAQRAMMGAGHMGMGGDNDDEEEGESEEREEEQENEGHGEPGHEDERLTLQPSTRSPHGDSGPRWFEASSSSLPHVPPIGAENEGEDEVGEGEPEGLDRWRSAERKISATLTPEQVERSSHWEFDGLPARPGSPSSVPPPLPPKLASRQGSVLSSQPALTTQIPQRHHGEEEDEDDCCYKCIFG